MSTHQTFDNHAGRRITFATIGDASEVRFWSGTPFHILLPVNATQKDYAVVISETFANSDRLAHLRRSSRDAYETRLNWKAWGRRVSETRQWHVDVRFSQRHPTDSGTSRTALHERGLVPISNSVRSDLMHSCLKNRWYRWSRRLTQHVNRVCENLSGRKPRRRAQ